MNRTISLQPMSLVAGLALGVLVLLSMSQVPVLNARNLNVQYVPDPRDCVQIREGTPFTVPSGRLLVVTALGSVYLTAQEAHLFVNDQEELVAALPSSSATNRIIEVPPGLTAQAGSVVTVTGTAAQGRVWGYLAPQ